MISAGIVLWAIGFFIDAWSREDSVAEVWGYLFVTIGVVMGAFGVAGWIWEVR